MANSTSLKVLQDGPRNVVVKFEGVLDTSDVAATGQIASGGFTTTTGSPNITFTAGALAPVVGQYVTFSDGTTTFPAGTYIVSITDATHIVVNNNAKATNAAAAVTITGTAGAVVILDPAVLSDMEPYGVKATKLRIKRVQYSIEDSLSVNLFWEATSNIRVEELVGRGKMDHYKFGGLSPTAAEYASAGWTGKIVATTQGWAASAVLSFSIVLECIKG